MIKVPELSGHVLACLHPPPVSPILVFQVGRETYQFTRLPFRLSPALRVFTTQTFKVFTSSHVEALLVQDRVRHNQHLPVTGSRQRPSDGLLHQWGTLLAYILLPSAGGLAALPQFCSPNSFIGQPETPTTDAGSQKEHPAPLT